MASPYALPSSALPHAHQHRMHSHSHSQTSLTALRASMSRESLPTGPGDDARDHERTHGRAGSQASNPGAALAREKPPPAALDTLEGWKQERTAGGKFVLTPADGAQTTPYSPPRQHQHHHHHHHHHHDKGHDHDHDRDHGHGHTHHDDHKPKRSWFTRMLLRCTARVPILHAILVERDSRRIFYFMTLNFCFMVVQAVYGYLTDSLGLLSDSVHMFFDCVALLVGLLAAVMSKWPPSQRFPYGFGKVETLSGFANGILLMLLSVEIAFEAFERLWEGTRTKRLGELFVVSCLGLAVNLVGMMAFGHHHHHGHGHGHEHEHSREDGHEHSPLQNGSPGDHGHEGHGHGGHGHEGHGHGGHGHEGHGHGGHGHGGHGHGGHGHGGHGHGGHGHGGHGHGCGSHDNDNMHGIYLHVLADTLGSVSVIASTALTSVWGWPGWDPLASCLIAVLIFLSARPLVMSSAKRLLLSVPQDAEYTLRNTLGGILQQRGVVSYAVPKLWLDDRTGGDGGSRLLGVVHVTAARGASLDETRERVREYLLREGIDAVVQAEREGDNGCWCARGRTPVTPQAPKPF